jgi:DMSO/TMAO reductase YedYZ molybdopterin-dependent catalytic subunit
MLHGAFSQAPFAPYALAEWVVRKSPGPLATYAIDHLGHRALPSIGYMIVAATLVLGFVLGRRSPWRLAAIALIFTVAAARLDPLPGSAGGTAASAIVAALTVLAAATAFSPARRPDTEDEVNWGRRRFLAGTSLGLIVIGVGGADLVRTGAQATPTDAVRADQPAVIPIDPTFMDVPGNSPRVTSRGDHYVVDIDIEDPSIGAAGWRLAVNGVVQTPQSFSLLDLQGMKTGEQLYTVTCISNNVGGDLVSNSRWTGVLLDDLLDRAAPLSSAVTLLAHSADGYEEGIPLSEIRNHGALVVFGMNGQLLPRAHGYPARLLFPNHYGMRSVKWLTGLKLLDHDQTGYWAQRGWDREAVIRTESRFDVPRDGDTLRSPIVCAGIAWAGTRDIESVEVSTDGGATWQQAQLEDSLGPRSWQRWQTTIDLPPGSYTLGVRSTDGSGMQEDKTVRPPHPSGASGYHLITIGVVA